MPAPLKGKIGIAVLEQWQAGLFYDACHGQVQHAGQHRPAQLEALQQELVLPFIDTSYRCKYSNTWRVLCSPFHLQLFHQAAAF